MPYAVSLISRSGCFKAVCTVRDAGIDVLITRRAGRRDSKTNRTIPDSPDRFMWAQSTRFLVTNRPWHVVVDAVHDTMKRI